MLVPQLLWFPRVRRSLPVVFVICLFVNVGMWFERFIIIVASLERDFLPSSWASYTPTSIEIATLIGSFGLFFTLFLVFCRFVPVIAMAEVKGSCGRIVTTGRTRRYAASPTGFPAASPERDVSRRLLVSVYENEEDILAATIAARRHGLAIEGVYTPYPVHGMDRAMGLPPSRLPWVCFVLALLGAGLKLLFEYWTSAVAWPINVGGKPWNSLPAFIPVTFEVMVLFAGVGTVVAFVFVTGLRPWRRETLYARRVTDDQFALVLAESGTPFDRQTIDTMLSRFHPVSIEEQDA